ncbi:MAG: SET domain-containing protein [Xanthobacteraceae bacterium]|nr:MAG: SET domain-containing protein [Xanthobacteraceae bacterium]
MAKFLSRRSYRVGRSRTGLGLFALVPIKKGTRIIRYWGPKLPAKVADEIDNKYMFEINSRWTVDGSIRRNTARYINHACKPNAESDIIGHLILIRAIKNIAPGEEITYDYGKNYFNTYIKPIGCKCGSCETRRRAERAEARAKARAAKQRAARKAEKQKTEKRKLPVAAKSSPRKAQSVKAVSVKSRAAKPRAVKKKASRPLARAA